MLGKRQMWYCEGFDISDPITVNSAFKCEVRAKSIDEARKKCILSFKKLCPQGHLYPVVLKRVR